MNPPNPEPHHHPDAHDLSRGTPANMLWGLLLTILTFLLVVVCILSIDLFTDAAGPEDPGIVDPGPDTPGTDTPGTDTPGTDTPGTDTPGTDTPGTDTPGPDTPGPDTPGPGTDKKSFVIRKTTASVLLDMTLVNSEFAVLVDVEAREIVAGLNFDMPIAPASMTKVMTLLVACEQLTDEQMTDVVVVPADVVQMMQQLGVVTGLGLRAGEELTVRDLLYAVALEDDDAAAILLARYVATTEQAFVELMNQKADELSLLATTFKNVTGLHETGHVTTCREMASIMLAAMDNEEVKELLSTKTYHTSNNVHPNGITFKSTYFIDIVENLRGMYQVQPAGGTILAAKTGKNDTAKQCLVTYYEAVGTAKPYVVVTAKAALVHDSVTDYIMFYEDYVR